MLNSVFYLPTILKKAKNMPNHDVHARSIFLCQNTSKMVNSLEFGIRNAKLTTLILILHSGLGSGMVHLKKFILHYLSMAGVSKLQPVG